jgi:hypothetical protein
MDTPTQTYSKGVLIQAKRVEPNEYMSQRDFNELAYQCDRMLEITAASFVFDYTRTELQCGAATRVAGSARRAFTAFADGPRIGFFLNYFDARSAILASQVLRSMSWLFFGALRSRPPAS